MAQLSEDIGLWNRTADGPELTDVGDSFVAEVLA